MRRITGLGVIFLILLATAISSENARRVAVLDFRNPAGLSDQEVNYITDLVRGEARRALPSGSYIVMTKENIYELLPPEKKNLTDCVGECEVETGRLIGADYIVTGEVVKFGGELRVSMKLFETKNGDLMATQRIGANKVLELEKPIEQACSKLFAALLEERTPQATKKEQPSTGPSFNETAYLATSPAEKNVGQETSGNTGTICLIQDGPLGGKIHVPGMRTNQMEFSETDIDTGDLSPCVLNVLQCNLEKASKGSIVQINSSEDMKRVGCEKLLVVSGTVNFTYWNGFDVTLNLTILDGTGNILKKLSAQEHYGSIRPKSKNACNALEEATKKICKQLEKLKIF